MGQSTTNKMKGFIGLADDTVAMKVPGEITSEDDAQILMMVNSSNF